MLLGLLLLENISCRSGDEMKNHLKDVEIEVIAHRGDKAFFPENTLPAFLSAVRKGLDGTELDVVISKDRKVVVSHEPFMSHLYMLTPEREPISQRKQKRFNLFEMTYDSIKEFDAGSKGNPRFPQQHKMQIHKPLLGEVIDSVESYISGNQLKPVFYMVEIKSTPENYGIYQPYPEEFVELVMQVMKEKNLGTRLVVQSFDPEVLNLLHKKYPTVLLSFLVQKGNLSTNLSLLEFKPDIYSPYYKLVHNRKMVDSVKEMNMKIIPWTVNQKKDLRKMIRYKVDGIITDHPERALELL